MRKYIIYIILFGISIPPAASQVSEKIQEMHAECRLVRGHANMIMQMIDENKFNESVARAHFRQIDISLKDLEFSLREIETLLTNHQRVRVSGDIDRLKQICNDTKPMVETLETELNAQESNIQRIRILASRIHRNLRNAMDILNQMVSRIG